MEILAYLMLALRLVAGTSPEELQFQQQHYPGRNFVHYKFLATCQVVQAFNSLFECLPSMFYFALCTRNNDW